VFADDCPVQKQDRDIQTVAPDQLGVPIDIDNRDWGQPNFTVQGLKLGHHLIAQVAVLPVDHRKCGFRQCLGPLEENELAIERTVSGGTSPTAVTFLPPITVE